MATIQYNYGADAGQMPVVTNGAFWVADRNIITGKIGVYKPIGVFQSAQIVPTISTEKLASSMFGVKQTIAQMVTAKEASLNLVLLNSQVRILQMALFADSAELTASAATDEKLLIEVQEGGRTPYRNRFLSALTEVSDKAGTVIYEEGKNYVADYSSIHIFTEAEQTLAGATAIIEDGDVVTISGKWTKTYVMQGLTKDNVEKALMFTGRNIANGQINHIALEAYRASAVPGSFELLSDSAFGTVPLNFELLADENIIGGENVSKLFTYRTTK